MLDLNTCLEKIVGLSENDCACYGEDGEVLGGIGGDVLAPLGGDDGFDVERPDAWNDSLSGLYLDDQKFSIPLKFTGTTKDCGEGNVWDILARARRHGVRNFITDLSAGMKAVYNHRLQKWSGKTAGTSHNYTVKSLKDLVGVYIDPLQYKGAKGIIDEVELYISTGTYEVNVYSTDDLTTPVNDTPIVVTTTNNFGRTKLATPLQLSFSDEYGRKVGYYVVYSRGSAEPRNIKFGCNCGGNDKPWQKHMKLYGVSADDAEGLESATRNTDAPYGVRLHFRVTCGMDWVCRTWDFSNDWDRVAAECIMLYGVNDLIERVLTDPQPVASGNPEMMAEKLNRNRAILSERMPWLSSNVPIEETDCYTCKHMYEVNPMLI